ncbi:MAG: TIGR02996 domain-containing protein [Myxococcaceae bacterium]|nr:TIGR02996 domain-containing protein [Myxococcaceae bacterium]
MAAKRTKAKTEAALTGPQWLALADAKDPLHLPALLACLEETSLPQLERRFFALALWPPTPAIGEAAASFFERFPVRFREQLGTGCAALGALVVHGAGAGFAKRLKKVDAPNDVVPAWRDVVAGSGAALLESRRAPTFNAGPAGPALPTSPRAALQEAWLSRAALHREADLPALLSLLADGPATDVTQRLSALVGWPRSPAIADAAARFIERPIVGFNASAAIFPVLALVLAAHGDASHADAAKRLGSEVASLAWLELVMSKHTRAPTPAKPARRDTSPGSEADFLRWLAGAPEDLTRRHAFADWLLEQGNPRGEFMALQLAALERPLDAKQQKRMAALQNKHQREWLKPFWKGLVKGTQRFEGGVLRELALSGWSPIATAAGDEPQLATLTSLELNGAPAQLAPIVESPLLRVRRLVVPAPMHTALPASVRERLETFGLHLSWGIPERTVQTAVPSLDAIDLPRVKTIVLKGQVRAETVPLLRAAKWPARISALEVESNDPTSFWAFARESSLRVLVVSPELGPNGAQHGQLTWRFTRDEAGWSLEVHGAEDVHESTRAAQRSILLRVLPTLDEALRACTTIVLPVPSGTIAAELRTLGVRPAGG